MATKNKNIKTYDLDNVFSEFTKSFSDAHASKRATLENQITSLEETITNSKEQLASLKASVKESANTQFDSRTSTDIQILLDRLIEERKSIVLLSDEDKAFLNEQYDKAHKYYQTNSISYDVLSQEDTSTLTSAQKGTHTKKLNAAKKLLDLSKTQYESLKAQVEENNKKVEDLKSLDEKIKALNEKLLKVSSEEESKYIKKKKSHETNYKKATDLVIKIKEDEKNLATLKAELKNLPKKATYSISDFEAFLTQNGLSTYHIEDLYNHATNEKHAYKIESKDFKMRKQHRKRDFVIKKMIIPAAVVGGATGLLINFILNSGAIAGSAVLGLPVFSDLILTSIASASIGAMAGAVASVVTFKLKKWLTKALYSLWYQNANKNLKEYQEGTAIENLRIAKLMQKVEKSTEKVLTARGLRKHIINAVNRNRIHHIEKYAKQLQTKYKTIETDQSIDSKVKAQALTPIYQLLKQVDTFIKNDVEKSITNAYLTCKESKKHNHPNMIENIDIYANLKIAGEAETAKHAKESKKNLAEKKRIATEIANGKTALTCVTDFEKKYSRFMNLNNSIPVTKSVLTKNNTVEYSLENGETITYPISTVGMDNVIGIKTSKKQDTIYFENGTKKIIKHKEELNNKEYITNDELLNSIQTNDTVADKMKQVYGTRTVKNLIKKLSEAIEEEKQITLSGKTKEAYNNLVVLEAENRKALKNDDIYVNTEDLGLNNNNSNNDTNDFDNDEILSL